MAAQPRPIAEQTLDELEGVAWGPPAFDSRLVTRAHRLRRVPIGQYGVEDLRLMIGQEIGLPYLVPLALGHLDSNALVAGDLYPGDLLAALARVSDAFWLRNRALVPRAIRAMDAALVQLHEARRESEGDDDDDDDDLAAELGRARKHLAALDAQ